MSGFRRWLAILGWFTGICVLMFGIAAFADCTCVDDDCYEDVVVSGAGSDVVNGTYVLLKVNIDGRPFFQKGSNIVDSVHYNGDWYIRSNNLIYYNAGGHAATPPHDGWALSAPTGINPLPTVSGGEACLPCSAPQLAGSPDRVVPVGVRYAFKPANRQTCGVTYAIVNLPSWASFDPASGQLSGTPGSRDIGSYDDIVITATDGSARTDDIGPFDIQVGEWQIVPLGSTGNGSILDRASGNPSSGTMLANTFQILDSNGNPTCGVPLHVCVYQTDYTVSPPVRTLVDYTYAACNRATGMYDIQIPAYAMTSSDYDVILSFSDEPTLNLPGLPSATGSILPGSSFVASGADAVIYEVGEGITGSCRILDANGLPLVTTYVHAYLYSVNASTRPETLHLVDHWTIRCSGGTSIYHLNIDTTRLMPGEYQISLDFEDGTSQQLRVLLVAPQI